MGGGVLAALLTVDACFEKSQPVENNVQFWISKCREDQAFLLTTGFLRSPAS
jgi:hypothetical protein